jgi:hypothetical protein
MGVSVWGGVEGETRRKDRGGRGGGRRCRKEGGIEKERD